MSEVRNDSEPQFVDKFVGFVDIIGFKQLTKAAEDGQKISLQKLLALTNLLGSDKDRQVFDEKYPPLCPLADRIDDKIDFQLVQISDCAIVSAEISPAGVINLLSHLTKVSFRLLQEGILCRGYVTRGKVYHTHNQVIGTGYIDAYLGEATVRAFRCDPSTDATPFIEIDQQIVEYVREQPDKCVKEMFGRLTASDNEVIALFPFKKLDPFLFTPVSGGGDLQKGYETVERVRQWITTIKDNVIKHVDQSNSKAARKTDLYIKMLDAQLAVCDKAEQSIKMRLSPWPAHRMDRKNFPGLFND